MNAESDGKAALQGRAPAGGSALVCFALLGAAVFASLAAWEVLAQRPGLGAPEELINFGQMLQWRQAGRGWLRIGGGALSQALMALALAPPLGWQAVYAFNALALGAAGWGLWTLARALDTEGDGHGEAAAGWALALAYIAPFSFLMARTTFTYVLAPALLLLLVLGLRRRQGAAASFALGAAAVLAWLDYEAWLLAYPVLLLAWLSAPRGARARFGWLLAGFAAGSCLLALAEVPYLSEWLVQRGHAGAVSGPSLASKLEGFFFGDAWPPAMGLDRQAALPLLAWPGLVAGLWRAPKWLAAWALIGLAGLAAGGPFLEPNRAIMAWPALLLISGIGTAWLLEAWPASLKGLVLCLALCLAPVAGYVQFDRAIAPWDREIHGPSRAVFEAARFLRERERSRPVVLGAALESVEQPLLARMLASGGPPLGGSAWRGGASGAAISAAETWYLIPRGLADPADPRWGRWISFTPDPDSRPLWLLQPGPRAADLLAAAGASLAPLPAVHAQPGNLRLALLRGCSDRARQAGAWAWTAWSEERLRWALTLGKAAPEDVLPLLQGPCLSSTALEDLAAALATAKPKVAELARARAAALARPGARWDLAFGKQG